MRHCKLIIVGCLLVLSGLAFATLGTEQVLNGDFFVDSIWVKPTGWTISGGTANLVSTGFGVDTLTQSLPSLVEGNVYEITYTIAAMDTVGVGYLQYYFGGTAGNLQLLPGTFTEQIVFSGPKVIEFVAYMSEGSTCVVDNVSVRWVIAVELTADYNADETVDVSDLLLFSADWLAEDPNIVTAACDHNSDGVVNFADYIVLSAQWGLGSVNHAPVATDQSETVMVGSAVQFALDVTDMEGDDLTYLITQSPTKGVLISLGGGVYRYRAYQDSVGQDTFQYVVSDGRLESNTATVTITIIPQVLDNVKYDGRATIEIADGGNVVLTNSSILTCWFRTTWRWGTLLSKRDPAGGPGLVVTIEDGYVAVLLCDQDGTEYKVLGEWRVDDGQWYFFGISITTALTDNIEIYVNGEVTGNNNGVYVSATAAGLDLTNTAPLVLGSYNNGMFYGAVDYVGNSASGSASILTLAGALIETRQGVLNMFSPVYHRRFLMNEGTGDTLTDEIEAATATLSNHYKINWATADAPLDQRAMQRSRLRGVDGNGMLPDFRKRK
ncbi:MAG: Ig-like domain-containing protein [Planctomycetaceae bacterium]|nr:Ig-like domain-containing protein [Planctomycetaceae bacterium]